MWHQMPLHVPKILLTFGAWASKDAQEGGSGKEEGNLIKMKRRRSITPLRDFFFWFFFLLVCICADTYFSKEKKSRYYVCVVTKSVGGWQIAGGIGPRLLRVGEEEKKKGRGRARVVERID